MTVRIQIFNLSYCMNVLISQPLSISFTMNCLYMSENKLRNIPQWSIYSFFFAAIASSTLSLKKSDSTRMAWISIHAWRIPARSRQQRLNQHRWKHQLYSGFWFLHQTHIIQVSTTSFFISLVGDKGSLHSYLIKIKENQIIIQFLYECTSQNLRLSVFHTSWFNRTLTQEEISTNFQQQK